MSGVFVFLIATKTQGLEGTQNEFFYAIAALARDYNQFVECSFHVHSGVLFI